MCKFTVHISSSKENFNVLSVMRCSDGVCVCVYIVDTKVYDAPENICSSTSFRSFLRQFSNLKNRRVITSNQQYSLASYLQVTIRRNARLYYRRIFPDNKFISNSRMVLFAITFPLNIFTLESLASSACTNYIEYSLYFINYI